MPKGSVHFMIVFSTPLWYNDREKRGEHMRKLVTGIVAHVDAGKTTLSEALLYTTGQLRCLGRVDHADTFLDTRTLERERGITIFTKEAVLLAGDADITLVDTPGHVDFSTEMERALGILDCAILVISGSAGVQAHTLTLWRLLERYNVPVFLFVNKMDQPGTDPAALREALVRRLGDGIVNFSATEETMWEEAATCDEETLTEYLETGRLSDETLRRLMAQRKLFPCYFGSALKVTGVQELLEGLARYGPRPQYPLEFGARIYKIARDSQGRRLTFLKVTGGQLRAKDLLAGGEGKTAWREKVDQLRRYSGEKFQTLDTASAGVVCAVTGLTRTFSGQGLGCDRAAKAPVLEPPLRCQVLLPEGADPHTALVQFRELEEEDPALRVVWNPILGQIHVQLMGTVQQEVLQRVMLDRFGLPVAFGPGGIVYKETIAAPVRGVGHYEPLRHYAEVHLLLEPLPPGSGIQYASLCREDDLDRNWQRLILTHLAEKRHIGVLTGSPITDIRLSLIAGRAHLKHTEGGDFREATYRAVRQGLMTAESVLLEPWYDFRLELPGETLGRAVSDVQRMGGSFAPPERTGEEAVLTGSAPVSEMTGYWQELAAYTRGQGRLTCSPGGYRPCHNAEDVIASIGYDPERDTENPTGSIFCAHGAGYPVSWQKVPAMAHVESGAPLESDKPPETNKWMKSNKPPETEEQPPPPLRHAPPPYPRSREEERELQAIYERTYGTVKPRAFRPPPKAPAKPSSSAVEKRMVPDAPSSPVYLLVDGYNIIFAWDELKDMAKENLESARRMLMDLLCNYQGFKKCQVILVFDAYKVKGNPGSVEHWNNIHVVYTKEAETADTYIERATYQIAKNHRVRVATSDALEQMIILGHGAIRISAREFHDEIEKAEGSIRAVIESNNRRNRQDNRLGNRAIFKKDE